MTDPPGGAVHTEYRLTGVQAATARDELRSLRTYGILCALGATIAVVGAIVTATLHSRESSVLVRYPYSVSTFRVTEVVWTLTHLLTFLGVLGLARSGLAGADRVGSMRGTRIASAAMLTGMALLAPFELGYVVAARQHDDSAVPNALGAGIGISAVLAGIGLTAVGVSILRTGRWVTWGRWSPLVCGLFVLLLLVPLQAIRPSIFLWPIAGWNVCLCLLGIALTRRH